MAPAETTAPSETRGPSIAYAMPKGAGSGTLTIPKPPLAVNSPLRNQGANHFGRNKHSFASIAYAVQKQLDRGPLTTPKPPLAPPLAPPTPAENGGPSDTAVRSETGGQSPRVQFTRSYVITPVLPHFYPLEGKMPRFYPGFTPFLPRFYPVAPISFYPSG